MKLDDVKKLQQKKYRSESGHFLIEGEHLVLELEKAVLQHPGLATSELFVTDNYQHWPGALKKTVVSEKQMAQLSDTKTPQGIVAVVPFLPTPPADAAVNNERAVYLHEIQDPGNLGTILRTLAWFGSFRCLLSTGSVDPYNPKVVRASMGAIFHVPMELDTRLDTLKDRYQHIACLDMHGSAVSSPGFKAFECYIFGNEARGIPREQLTALAAQPFTIAGSGAIESLNLASAVNMCVYELARL